MIGDAVNLSSRLQNLTRRYAVPTIVGEETAKSVDDIIFRELDTVTVRGKHELTRIYQPFCMRDQLTDKLEYLLTRHRIALKKYYANDDENAVIAFTELLSETNQDPYYQCMLENIAKRNIATA